MLTTRQLERKIKNFHSINEIVNSMKALASLSIRKAESILPSIRVYIENIEDSIANVLHFFPEAIKNEEKEEQRKVYVVFSSEQGLCGVFNEKIIEYCRAIVDENTVGFVISGRKGYEEAISNGLHILKTMSSPISVDIIDVKVMNLASELYDLFKEGAFHELNLVFAYHRKIGDYKIVRTRVLPPAFNRIAKRGHGKKSPLIYMKPEEILERLIEEYILISLYRAYIESFASENASRLSSMETASRNIEKRLQEMQSTYNYIRQEEITEETIEIISGYEAFRD